MKGKDVTLNKGVTFDVFTDSEYVYEKHAERTDLTAMRGVASGAAAVALTSTTAGAEIEVDGAFVGSTPTTLQLSAGQHRVVIRSGDQIWNRTVQLRSGDIVTLNAAFKQ